MKSLFGGLIVAVIMFVTLAAAAPGMNGQAALARAAQDLFECMHLH